jgi:hypothetical protein
MAPQVNADEHRSLGQRFDVKGFPTIKFFPRGKAPTKDSAERCAGPGGVEGTAGGCARVFVCARS